MPSHAPTAIGNADAVAPVSPPASGLAPAAPPANLLVKIVDFGIAKLRESATHTLTGTALGTPADMSYRQASGTKSDELDARSDIYLLGVVSIGSKGSNHHHRSGDRASTDASAGTQ